jgi:N-acetylglucosaminyl-diphospho-decaprenol L-rhamnosyltransferase
VSELSYCVVNTNGRDELLACLEAIERTHPEGVAREVLVLDNASDDGSVEAVRASGRDVRLIALERRAGKAENDSRVLREARGRYCLLLNEDTELRDGCARALLDALDSDPGAAAAGAQLLTSDGRPTACAWRLPDVAWALAAAVFLHDRVAVESRGAEVREVGWAQSSALLVRREAAARVGWLDPDFFVYSDETDFCRRLRDAGWRILFVPGAQAVHHDQLSTDAAAMRRRIVEFHRGRDLYFRKHRMPLTRLAWRVCWTWAYLVRAGAAAVLPGHDPRRYLLHARQQAFPGRGEGIREAAEEYNRRRAAEAGSGMRHPLRAPR